MHTSALSFSTWLKIITLKTPEAVQRIKDLLSACVVLRWVKVWVEWIQLSLQPYYNAFQAIMYLHCRLQMPGLGMENVGHPFHHTSH